MLLHWSDLVLVEFGVPYLEMINGDKVREERQNVLDLEEFALVEECHGSFHILFLFHNMPGYKQRSHEYVSNP